MKHLLLILFMAMSVISYSQKSTFTTSAGISYTAEGESIGDAIGNRAYRSGYVQLSYQIFLSEQWHQFEPFVRIRQGFNEGVNAGFMVHINAIPFYNDDSRGTNEKWYVRGLIGAGFMYDSFEGNADFPIEIKLSARLNRALLEIGGRIKAHQTYFYGADPQSFITLGWVF